MIDELLTYYNSELAFLREQGAEFAEKYPRVAARLLMEADKCEDPHVERILEGVAFLTARIRRKIDDEFPEITDSLLSILDPHSQRPIPSMSIVQFVLNREGVKLTNGFTVERGSRLNSRPVAGVPCQFQTAYPVTLWPIEVEAARLDPDRVVFPGKPPEAVALLQLSLRCSAGATFSQLADRSPPLPPRRGRAAPLHPLRAPAQQRLRRPGPGTAGARSPLRDGPAPPAIGRPGRLRPRRGDAPRLEPIVRRLSPAPGILRAPREVPLLRPRRACGAWPAATSAIRSTCCSSSNRSPRHDLTVQPENFRLGCTPVVNLFSMVAEPIPLSQTQTEYRVVPDVHRTSATEVFSIDEVTSTGGFLDEPVAYEPFYSLAARAAGPAAEHVLVRVASALGEEGRPGDRGLPLVRRSRVQPRGPRPPRR